MIFIQPIFRGNFIVSNKIAMPIPDVLYIYHNRYNIYFIDSAFLIFILFFRIRKIIDNLQVYTFKRGFMYVWIRKSMQLAIFKTCFIYVNGLFSICLNINHAILMT